MIGKLQMFPIFIMSCLIISLRYVIIYSSLKSVDYQDSFNLMNVQ